MLAFVITTSDADRVDPAQVPFRLWMNIRIPIHFTRRRLQNPCACAPCQAQHIDGTMHNGLGGLDGIMLVVNGRRGACQIQDLVNLNIKRISDIVPYQLKHGVDQQMIYVRPATGRNIIYTNHLVPVGQQALTQVSAKKARPTRHKYAAVIHDYSFKYTDTSQSKAVRQYFSLMSGYTIFGTNKRSVRFPIHFFCKKHETCRTISPSAL